MDRHGSIIRAAALALADRIALECVRAPSEADVPAGQPVYVDRRRIGLLIAELVARAVEQERELCAMLADDLERRGASRIGPAIRARGDGPSAGEPPPHG